MSQKAGEETNNPSAFSEGIPEKKTLSKSSIRIANDVDVSKRRKSSPTKEKRSQPKTAGGIDTKARKHSPPKRQSSDESWMLYKGKSETTVQTSLNEEEQEHADGTETGKKGGSLPVEKRKMSTTEIQKILERRKKKLIYGKPSETYLKLLKEGSTIRCARPKANATSRPSEIPKLRQLAKLRCSIKNKTTPSPPSSSSSTPRAGATRVPRAAGMEVATTGRPESKETEQNKTDNKQNGTKSKKEAKLEEKIKEALKENFDSLVPVYETELKKITDNWVNTVYCSLTLRTNLVKLLFEAIPSINRSQFQMEDETILHTLARAKNYTKSEAEGLILFIKLLIANRDQVKEEYTDMLTKIEIAETYNNNWKTFSKKIRDMEEETKELQLVVPELLKKKEAFEVAANEKIKKMESSIGQREEEIKKLENQLRLLKQREHSYKGNISLKIEDYKDIKEEVLTLQSMEKEYEELKDQYNFQNDVYEKNIKDLENQLEERRKTLNKEKELKKQLKTVLIQLQSQQQHLYRTIGKEQVEYVLGRTDQERNNRRDQLWLSAIKLVMKGFLVQMKKLERDRNKMLLELNSNDFQNYSSLATAIMQKDNFMKSIRQQMQAFSKASKYTTAKISEISVRECVKTEEGC